MSTFESREQVEKTIAGIQSAVQNNASNMEAMKTDLQTALRDMREAQAIANTPKADAPESVLGDYRLSADEASEVIRNAPRNTVRQDEGGAVVLRGIDLPGGDYLPGLLDDEPQTPWQADLQRAITDRNMVRMWQRNPHTPASDRRIQRLLRRAPTEVAKIFVDSSGVGAEAIFDNFVPELDRYVDMRQRIAALFQSVSVSGGATKNPFLDAGLRLYKKRAATTDDPAKFAASTPSMSERSYEPVSMSVRLQLDEDATEDTFLNWMATGRDLIVDAIVDGVDDAIINGDLNATHQDDIASWDIRSRWGASGLGGATDHRRLFTGLRARAYDVSNTNDASGTQSANLFRESRARLAAPHGLGSCVYLVSYEYYLTELVKFDDFKSLEKFGPNATMIYGNLVGPLPGQVGEIDGVPVCVTWYLSNDLATTGLFTGTGATTGWLTVNRDRFRRFVRRSQRIETAKDITRGVYDMVGTYRMLFDTIDASTVDNVAWDFNV